MVAIKKLYSVEVAGRDLGQFTATELRELMVAADEALFPLGRNDAVIFDQVCAHFAVTRSALFDKNRRVDLSWPRQVLMYLLVTERDHSAVAVDRFFERKNGAVLHALRVVKNRMETEPTTARNLYKLRAQCREGLKQSNENP